MNGILMVTRTFGDGDLKVKGVLTAQPEIRFHELSLGDDYVVLASDGMWDVISNDQAAKICMKVCICVCARARL